MTDRWTPQQERVALALINAAEPDPSLRYATVDDIPYPRLRSEIPFARAAIAALADDLLPDTPDDVNEVWVYLLPKDRPFGQYSAKDIADETRLGTGPTIPVAINDALKGATGE